MRSAQSGFTLLELVAALAIFALVAVMAYGGLAGVLRNQEALNDGYSRIERWQRGVHRMRQDIEQAQLRSIRDEFGDTQPAMWTPVDDRLELTRGGRANPLVQPRSNLERVAYYLEEDKLIRASWLMLDRTQGMEPYRLELLDGIRELRWRFLRRGAKEWEEEWGLDQNAGPFSIDAQRLQLPAAVELEMDSRELGIVRLVFLIEAAA